MFAPRIRPRFDIRTHTPPDAVLRQISEALAKSDARCEGAVQGRHIHLNVGRSERKIWSPHLNLEVLADGRGTVISGHYGPRADIWTLIMALYAVSVFSAVMAILFAISQLLLNGSPTALWVVVGALFLGVVVYVLAWIGQRLSEGQMEMMKGLVSEAVGED